MGLFGNIFKSGEVKPTSSNVINESEFNSFADEISVMCYVLSMSKIAFIEYSYEIGIEQIMERIKEKFSSIEIAEEGVNSYTFSDGKVFRNGVDILWSYDPIVDEESGISAVVFSVCPVRGDNESDDEWQAMVRAIATLASGIKNNPVEKCIVEPINIVEKTNANTPARIVFSNAKLADAVRKSKPVKL